VTRPDAEGNPVGRIGIAPLFPKLDRAAYHVLVQHSFPESLFRAVDKTVELSGMTLKAFYRMLTGSLSWKNVSGPVTMADVAGQSLQAGWVVYLNYLALISVSLGVMNLLPIPVLDGGHIVYESIAWLRGNRPLDMKWLERGQQVGIAILGALMMVAFYNDLIRVLGDFAK
jgi:regulator of sigma E protease